MFAGFLNLGDRLVGAFVVKKSQESPQNPDGPPTFKVYGPGGLMQHGTGIATKLDGVPGLYQYSIADVPSNGYKAGVCYRVFLTDVIRGLSTYEPSLIVI